MRVPLLTGGEPFDSRSLMGKKVLVLRFQASWCKSCASQAAGIERIYERYKDRGVELLAIQVDDPEKEARASREQLARRLRDRDRLIDAYVVRLKACLLQGYPASQMSLIEVALREHLTGKGWEE